jgi:hypothetical protein
VLRPSSLSRALAVVTAVVLGGTGPLLIGPPLAGSAKASAAAPADPTQALTLHMHSITPDYIPDHGPIVVRGRVTNTSDEEWTAINVHGFIGSSPITTGADLAAAAKTPVSADIGHRITTAGTFDHINRLEPGQSTSFTVRLPRSKLPVSAPGVYWFGVHALGSTAEGRSASAAGRDRTFLPLVPKSVVDAGAHVDTALVVPVRAEVTRGSEGVVEDVPGWVSSLRSGALHSAVDVGRAAHDTPLTWLVDPAVPDTVRALVHGNPGRTLTAPGTSHGGPSGNPSPSADSSATGAGTTVAAPTSRAGRVGKHWLRRLHHLLADTSDEIVGLPYGDLEVGSAARYDRPYLDAVLRRTGDTLRPWKLPLGATVVAPPSGRLNASVTTAIPRQTSILLDDRGVTGHPPVVDNVNGRRVILASAGAAEGGPGPVDPLSPLALRQRILSEAALRLLGDAQPLVVELPSRWRHRVPRSFFSGLDVPWLTMTTLEGATTGASTPLRAARLRQPATSSPQLGPELFTVVNQVLAAARTLQSVLPGNRVLRRHILDETTGNTSYAASDDPFGAMARLRSTSSWLTANLGGVTLAAPESVTLASASGRFSAQVSNTLDVPVTVKVRAVSDSRLRITGGETVPLPPHGSTTVLLNASTHVLGVHTVTLELTNQAGVPLGSEDAFPMRAEQVSRLIWVIIGVGLALLFGAIVVRLVRRVRRSRA